ncbi:MAG: hypothetical protein ACK5ML_13870 [Lachnospiraceae bacterium]
MKGKKPHCPYCSNHCPLDKPKCKKGKELAAALAAGDATLKSNRITEKKDVKDVEIPADLSALLNKVSTASKQTKKDIDDILAKLEDSGKISLNNLQTELGLKKKDLEKELKSLKKKKLIHLFQEGKDNILVLSKEGHKKAQKLYSAGEKGAKLRWEALSDKEREDLFCILQKLNGIKVISSEDKGKTPENGASTQDTTEPTETDMTLQRDNESPETEMTIQGKEESTE